MRIHTRRVLTKYIALERLHLLKKDASQLGQNARKAVKFLDHVSSTADLPGEPVIIQGPDDQYMNWTDLEHRYTDSIVQSPDVEVTNKEQDVAPVAEQKPQKHNDSPEKMINDLSLSSDDIKASPVSTPPLSPSSSEPQSAKTTPEVRCAKIAKQDATPIPPALKALINFVVWYTYERNTGKDNETTFLTNSADAAQIAKDFNVTPKTIHQLRASIPTEQELASTFESQVKTKKRGSHRALSSRDDSEPKTLFRYEDGSSEDEELIFKPRSRDLPRPLSSAGRPNTNAPVRGRGALHSPSNSINASTLPKPQVPVEEIDPDSFDRGIFARGSTPLANVGNHYGQPNNTSPAFARGGHRNFSSPMSRGGGHRGGTLRGRGRGRLFVP